MRMQMLLCFLSFLSCVCFPLFSVGPHYQLYSASKFLDQCVEFSSEDQMNFYVGSMFLDIWTIAKDKPHPQKKEVTIEMLKQESNPFQKGVLFYHVVSSMEEKLSNIHNAHRGFPEGLNDHETYVINNMAEDLYVYESTFKMSRQVLANILSCNLHTEPELFGYTQSDILHWFMGVSSYFMTHPKDTFKNLQGTKYIDTDLTLDLTDRFYEDLTESDFEFFTMGEQATEFVKDFNLELDKFLKEYNLWGISK